MAKPPPPDFDDTPVEKIDPCLTDPNCQEKIDAWIGGRARYADPYFVDAYVGLPTTNECKEVQPGRYLDLAKEKCVSKTCTCMYRYECETGDEYGRTCRDPACNAFCT